MTDGIPNIPRPSQLWKHLTADRKAQAADAFWRDENAAMEQAEVIAVPGHTPACVAYKVGDAVFIGDTITAKATVLSVHPSKPVTQLGIAVTRDDGTVVLEGEAWCYTFAAE